jgi:ubiquinol-cytochrome c reductase cytochrome c subunit
LKQAVSYRRAEGMLPRKGGIARLIVLLAAIALVTVASRRAEAQVSSGNAKNGKQIYMSYGCFECHGREGQGSVLSGPRVGPHPTPFSAFVKYIRQPKGQMPPYTEKVVSDAELADIYAFLQSLPQPPDPKSIPLLSSESGAQKSK